MTAFAANVVTADIVTAAVILAAIAVTLLRDRWTR